MSTSLPKLEFSILRNWLNWRNNEQRSFLLASCTLFFITASNVLFNNFAETAFLRRFGVDFLPAMIMVNAIVTIIIMSFVGRLLSRFSGQIVLRRVLIFCALSAVLARLAIPADMGLLYPVIYVIKTQFELLLTLLFWNLANQIFPTRLSKRFFPLMVSGGIVGGLIGSLATPLVARFGSIDDVLWAYIVGLFFVFFLTGHLSRSAALKQEEVSIDEKPDPDSSFWGGLRNALPLIKKSGLVRWLVLLTLIPNMVVPLLNYQVSYAVDMTYPNEAAMLHFFSIYRAVQFALALFVSLFAGKIYSRFGLTGGLLVHPINYLLVFVVFMLQFDLLTAVYAGISVRVIRRAVQNPARTALMGLFSNEQRVLLMPFLRGVVLRMGTLVGATLVFVCQAGYFVVCRFPLHPQNLAPFGFAFTVLWLVVALRMRKRYLEVVLETLGWRGSERGRLKISGEKLDHATEQLAIVIRKLSQAAAVQRLVKSPSAEKLVGHLTETAGSLASDILQNVESEDPSGRLRTICSALEGDDMRRRSNAFEALELFFPQRISRDLVRGLEKSLRGFKHHSKSILQDLVKENDPAIVVLVHQLRVETGEDFQAG